MGVRISDEELEGKVVAGVDTHADTHWLCVLDDARRVMLSEEFPADAQGYADLCEAIGDPGGCAAVGVEGTQSYGAGLVDELTRRGFRVLEVLRPKRDDKRRRGEGKDDGIDAERAARDVVAGKVTSVPKLRGGWVDDVRSLLVARNHAVKGAVENSAAAESLLMTAPEDVRAEWRGLSKDKIMAKALGMEEDGASALMLSLRSLAELWDLDRRKADELEARIEALLREHCPSILRVYGCGVVSAAELVVSAGENPKRFKSEAAFAKHCGAAPIPASSGKTSGRMRLSRGGDRTANKALHQVTLTRMAHDDETKAYVERRTSGKNPLSKAEVMRCLKRYVSREVYWALKHPFGDPAARRGETSGQELKEARLLAGLTQREAAAQVGISASTPGKIETGKLSGRSKAAKRYAAWVGDGMPVDVA
jgi:transposase/DNA-binding XRE family transcriptional regulator